MILYLIQLHDDMDSILLAFVVSENFYAFGLIFAVCELYQRETNAFEETSETIDQLDWYEFPAETQHMLPFIINFTQQPVEFTCFGSRAFNRELLKLVRT